MEHVTTWACAGVIMVVYQATQGRFGVLIRGIEELLEGTSQEQWTDQIAWLGRPSSPEQ